MLTQYFNVSWMNEFYIHARCYKRFKNEYEMISAFLGSMVWSCNTWKDEDISNTQHLHADTVSAGSRWHPWTRLRENFLQPAYMVSSAPSRSVVDDVKDGGRRSQMRSAQWQCASKEKCCLRGSRTLKIKWISIITSALFIMKKTTDNVHIHR